MEDIFERLPNNLHLSRNSNAPEFDRWRLYNTANNKYLEKTGATTALECIQRYIAIEDKQRKEWVN